MLDEYVRTEQAARIANLSKSKFEKMRLTGEGPPFCKAGLKVVVYRVQDVVDWLESRKIKSTSEG